MSKAYEFLKECGAFFVLSINGDYPAGRPFGAVMEVGDDLYLSRDLPVIWIDRERENFL